jgi:hypothetical protein
VFEQITVRQVRPVHESASPAKFCAAPGASHVVAAMVLIDQEHATRAAASCTTFVNTETSATIAANAWVCRLAAICATRQTAVNAMYLSSEGKVVIGLRTDKQAAAILSGARKQGWVRERASGVLCEKMSACNFCDVVDQNRLLALVALKAEPERANVVCGLAHGVDHTGTACLMATREHNHGIRNTSPVANVHATRQRLEQRRILAFRSS